MDLGFVSLNTPRDLAPGVLGPELESRGFESMWVGEHPQIPVAGQESDARWPAQRAEAHVGSLPVVDGGDSGDHRSAHRHRRCPAAGARVVHVRKGSRDSRPAEQRATVAGRRRRIPSRARTVSIDRWSDRYRALGDMVAALDTLWTDDEAEYHGEFYDFDRVWSYPKPHQRPRPPLLAATTGPKATRDCLAWADGWLPGDAAYRDVTQGGERLPPHRGGSRSRPRDAGSDDHGVARAHAGSAGRLPGSRLQPCRGRRRAARPA